MKEREKLNSYDCELSGSEAEMSVIVVTLYRLVLHEAEVSFAYFTRLWI